MTNLDKTQAIRTLESLPSDLVCIAKEIKKWPDNNAESVYLSKVGEICFIADDISYDFYAEDIDAAKVAFIADKGCYGTGKRYPKEQIEEVQELLKLETASQKAQGTLEDNPTLPPIEDLKALLLNLEDVVVPYSLHRTLSMIENSEYKLQEDKKYYKKLAKAIRVVLGYYTV